MVSRRPWTEDDRAEALRLLAEGVSHAKIGERFGRTASAITNLRRLSSGRGYCDGRQCGDCSQPIRNENKSGRCKRCATVYNNQLPETKQKRVESWRRLMQDPAAHAKMAALIQRNYAKAMVDPVKRAAAAERGAAIYRRFLATPEMRERLNGPEVNQRRGRTISEKRLAWCPAEFRALHHRNVHVKGIPAAQSRQLIEELHKNREAARSGHLDSALFWLNRIVPTKSLGDGTFRFGGSILSASEVLETAKRRGWQPVDNGENRSIVSNSRANNAKEQTGNTQEEKRAA